MTDDAAWGGTDDRVQRGAPTGATIAFDRVDDVGPPRWSDAPRSANHQSCLVESDALLDR